MHVKEILEAQIERERIDMLIARQYLEIYREAMNDPKLTEPGNEYWQEKLEAAKRAPKILMSPDRDQLILVVTGAFSTVMWARSTWADSERERIQETIFRAGYTSALKSRLDDFSPDKW